VERNQCLQRIAEQERGLVLDALDEAFAWHLGSRLRELAAARGLPVAIDVRRIGLPLFYAALPGATPDNVEWLRRKSNVVARFHRSSYAVGLGMDPAGPGFNEKYALPLQDYAAHGGAFPLAVAGTGVVGSVAVSGLKQRDDHELVVEALCHVLQRDHGEFAMESTGRARSTG
jgi:uncharacterized protein (UPF0303 family)